MPYDTNQGQLGQSWNRKIMRIDEAVSLAGTRGEGIKVAILDTGVNYNHPDIRNRFDPEKRGYNFVLGQDSNEPMDNDIHGTLVGRILAGEDSGIAPRVNLYALKLSDTKNFLRKDIIKALDWCIRNDIDIVNMSFGGPIYREDTHRKCEEAYKKGITLVAAAGNFETGAYFPASFYDEAISVASIGPCMDHCIFSNVWPSADISAPGRKFPPLDESALTPEDEEQGTSYSAPQISGIIAIGLSMLKRNGKIASPEEIDQVLKETAMDLSDEEDAQKLVDEWIEIYDPHRKLFKKDKTLIQCMYGAGLAQADKFIKRLREIKEID